MPGLRETTERSIKLSENRLSVRHTSGRASVEAAVKQGVKQVKSWLLALREFLLETSGWSVLISIVPIMYTAVILEVANTHLAGVFYGQSAVSRPPVTSRNISVVPIDTGSYRDYYVDPGET